MERITRVRKTIIDGMVQRVIDDAAGSSFPSFERYKGPTPDSLFWLGWLAPEARVLHRDARPAMQRFTPASQGFRFRVGDLPLDLDITVSLAVWVTLHPTLSEQRARAGLQDEDDEPEPDGNGRPHHARPERGQPLARVRMKVPIEPVALNVRVDSSGETSHGSSELSAAVAAALARLPGNATPYRPLRRGGSLPRHGDVDDGSSWASWERANLDESVLPRWLTGVFVEVTSESTGDHEVLVTVVNRTPYPQFVDSDETREFPRWAFDPNVYEVALSCRPSLPTRPYQLEDIPRSYRYDRDVPALGENAAVELDDGTFFSRFAAVAETDRIYPREAAENGSVLDTTFASLKDDPLPVLEALLSEARQWTEAHWGSDPLDQLARTREWSDRAREEAAGDAQAALEELGWVEKGLELLRADTDLLKAFKWMNETMELVAEGKYEAWRPFQLAFILGCLAGVQDPAAAPEVDILWFSTGGGKTEAYLGLNVLCLFYGRLKGRRAGAQTWARFPLRLLSLQQTQRIADSVLLAEVVRLRIPEMGVGEPFAVGYYVGAGNTPNKITLPGSRFYDGWDPFNAENQESCRVLERCPACRGPEPPEVRFDEDSHTMIHVCTNDGCPLPYGQLPVYVIDDDIYRWAPSVIVGTVDKLAQLGQQASFRVLLGQALARCPKHGYSAFLDRCAVFPCNENLRPVDAGFGGLMFEIQDELHLLSESLGALDGNYETLFQELVRESGGGPVRIVAATATIEGYVEQSDHLYRREPRRFPLPGPRKEESFWAFERADDPLRTYVAMLPRGTTMLNAAFFVTRSHWQYIENGMAEPEQICRRLGLDESETDDVAGSLRDLYEVMVTYALRKQDLERYAKDIAEDREIAPSAGNYDDITGDREFWNIRTVLNRLEHPSADREDRVRVLGATSAISHGVDVNRLNVMTVMGMPQRTAEFIQATARVGREQPGAVFALINPMRVRDVSHFRYFQKYAEYLDRLVEGVPVNRESLPVLKRVVSGGLMAWFLQVDEPEWLYPGGRVPRRRRDRLWKVKGVADAIDEGFICADLLRARLMRSFSIDATHPRFAPHREEIDAFVARNLTRFQVRRGAGADTKDEVDPPPPRSLRDLETAIQIRGDR